MDWSSPHAGFVIACYVVSFLVIAGLTGWIVWRDRTLKSEISTKVRHPRTSGGHADQRIEAGLPPARE